MSMSVSERRTEVLHDWELPGGKVRLVKASNKYDDRRFRHLAVEWCPPQFIGTPHEEHGYRVLRDWHPARDPNNMVQATAFYSGVAALLRVQAERR